MNVGKASYVAAFELGKPMGGGCVARVARAGPAAALPVGAVVVGPLQWVSFQVWPADRVPLLQRIDPVPEGVPLSYYLGVLGMPGLTAYVGLTEIGRPKQGETLYVSAASGAVGLVVCQLGKLMGLRVVGSAGSAAKVEHLVSSGAVDAAFDYHQEAPASALPRLCPNGIDIYFENVGGETLEAVLPLMNNFGRIIACGMISGYNGESYGIKNLFHVVSKRLTIKGFIVGDHPERKPEFYEKVPRWVAEGKIKYVEHIVEGFENIPSAFVGLFTGDNLGKAVVKVD
ncbi:hypothetical protein HK405_009045 [Cladochytrium tenue]|nr:hypothetical protein HK405_009045 [Cladochytrium tenue]